MIEQIDLHIKEAMKSREKERLNALRFLKSRLLENKTAPKPKAPLEIVISHCKKLKDSLSSFPEGSEVRENTVKELDYLKVYLPKPMEEVEVRQLVSDIISKVGKDPQSMGKVMKELSPIIKGKFDGKLASELVRDMLSN